MVIDVIIRVTCVIKNNKTKSLIIFLKAGDDNTLWSSFKYFFTIGLNVWAFVLKNLKLFL